MRATTLLKGAEVAKKQTTQGMKRHPKMPQMRRLTQQELLAEAKVTEEQNTASLAQFLKLEEEKKKVKVTKVIFNAKHSYLLYFKLFLLAEICEMAIEHLNNDGVVFIFRFIINTVDSL